MEKIKLRHVTIKKISSFAIQIKAEINLTSGFTNRSKKGAVRRDLRKLLSLRSLVASN